jgi:hypothetical protein
MGSLMGQDTETKPPDLGDEMPVAGHRLVILAKGTKAQAAMRPSSMKSMPCLSLLLALLAGSNSESTNKIAEVTQLHSYSAPDWRFKPISGKPWHMAMRVPALVSE